MFNFKVVVKISQKNLEKYKYKYKGLYTKLCGTNAGMNGSTKQKETSGSDQRPCGTEL